MTLTLKDVVTEAWTMHNRIDRVTHVEGTTVSLEQGAEGCEVVVRIPDEAQREKSVARRRIDVSLAASTSSLAELMDRAIFEAAQEIANADPWFYWS